MSQLHDGDIVLDWGLLGQQFQLECYALPGRGLCTDGGMGKEEGEEISDRIWRQVQEAPLLNLPRCLLGGVVYTGGDVIYTLSGDNS